MRRISLLFLLFVAACGSRGGIDAPAPQPVRPVAFVDNAWTQPVPAWGSPVRLGLPVPLNNIVLGPSGGLGAYGAHEGGHVEGLDHVWIPITPGTVVGSWAAGTVTKIENMGGGEFYITVDYGQGLVGKHMQVYQTLVKVGDSVKEGTPVAMGSSAEFMLIDNNRSDGERTGGMFGSYVSPFDYLRDDVKAALVARHVAEVVTPYFMRGLDAGNHRPVEPLLTNKMFYHGDHRGTIVGEWIMINKGWSGVDPLYYEVMTVHDATNAYGHFQRAEFEDHPQAISGKTGDDSNWEPGDAPGRIKFTMTHFGVYYGLYSVDENGSRAKLTIEWRRDTYPAAITANAAVYVERAPIYLYADAQALGLIK